MGWPLLAWPYWNLILRTSGSFDHVSSELELDRRTNNLFVFGQSAGFMSAPFFGYVSDSYGPVVLGVIAWIVFLIHASFFILAAAIKPTTDALWIFSFSFLGFCTPSFMLSHQATSLTVSSPRLRLFVLNLTIGVGGGTILYYELLFKIYEKLNYPSLAKFYSIVLIVYIPLIIAYAIIFIFKSNDKGSLTDRIPHMMILRNTNSHLRTNPAEIFVVFILSYLPQVLTRSYYSMLLLDRTSREFTVKLGWVQGLICLISGITGSGLASSYPPYSVIVLMTIVGFLLGWAVLTVTLKCDDPCQEVLWWTGGITFSLSLPLMNAMRFSWIGWKLGSTEGVGLLLGGSAMISGLVNLLLYIPNTMPETQRGFDIAFGMVFPPLNIIWTSWLMYRGHKEQRLRIQTGQETATPPQTLDIIAA